jgi:predicted nucleic acid-binding protein
MKIFFDTSFFIALFVNKEKYHQRVKDKYNYYKNQRAVFFTSDYILDELFTRIGYDFGARILDKIIKILQKGIKEEELRVLRIDERTFQKATAVMLKFSDQKISFTDATTYVLSRDFALDEIATLDADFIKMRLQSSF